MSKFIIGREYSDDSSIWFKVVGRKENLLETSMPLGEKNTYKIKEVQGCEVIRISLTVGEAHKPRCVVGYVNVFADDRFVSKFHTDNKLDESKCGWL